MKFFLNTIIFVFFYQFAKDLMNKFFSDISWTLNSYYESIVLLIPRLALAILVFIIAYFLANGIKALVVKRVSPKMDDPLLAKFLSRVAKVIILLIGILLVLNIIGLGGIAGGLMASAGVSAFVIGFAFKDIGENFLAGIILAFDRPFRIGDTVELDGIKGLVITLNLRNTQLKTFDGKDIYIPNADVVKNPVVNYTIDGFLRQTFSVGLDYGSNVHSAIGLIMEEMNKVNGILQKEKKASVGIGEMTASSLNLDVYYWLDTFDKSISGSDVRIEVITKVLARLEKEGFYLPGDIIELKNYNEGNLSTKDKTNIA